MNEMSNSDPQFGSGFSTGREFLTSRDPPFGHPGPRSTHFYGSPPPPDNYRGIYQGSSPLPGIYQDAQSTRNYHGLPSPPRNYYEPSPLSGIYQDPRSTRNHRGPPSPPRNYYDTSQPSSMRGPPFHHMRSPPGMMQLTPPSEYDSHRTMYGTSFDSNFSPRRRPRMEPAGMRGYNGRPWMNSNTGTWRKVYHKVYREPPKNEWERKENWWNDAIQQAVIEKKIARKNWKISRSQRDRKIYMEKKKNAKRQVAQSKARTFEAMCPGESRARKGGKKNSSNSNEQDDTTEGISQAKDSDETSVTEDQGNISSLSKDQDNTADISQTKHSDGISAISEYQDSSSGEDSQ